MCQRSSRLLCLVWLGEGLYIVSQSSKSVMFWSQQETCLWHAILWLWTRSSDTILPANKYASTSKANTECLVQQGVLMATKAVSVETMTSAAEEIHSLKHAFQDGLVKCNACCDGTWQRRGFSSLNGCVTAISLETRKILDVVLLSKVCKKCREYGKKN